MTTIIVYGKSSDGYLFSTASTNATAAAGSSLTLTAGTNSGYYGTWYRSAEGYRHHQTFIGFDFTAIASTELLTSAQVRVNQTITNGPSVTRAMELRGFAWSGSGLTTADWRTTSGLGSLALFGKVSGVQAASGKAMFAGSDAQRDAIAGGVTNMEYVVVTDRQRAATAPTTDESAVIYTSEGSGTTYDPQLVMTTVTRSMLVPVLGAQARLSDGTWLVLKSTGTATPTITVNWISTAGAETLISTLSMGTTSGTYDYGIGAQSLALVVDSADNFYVIGTVGGSQNTLQMRAYAKNASPGSWTAKNLYQAVMPVYDVGSVNNIAAAWHNVAGGTLAIFVAHTAGYGVSGSTGTDISYVLISSSYLLSNGTGTLIQGSGSALGGVIPAASNSDFNSFANETGTGLDVVPFAGTTNPAWGAVVSFQKGVRCGESGPASIGRYILNGTGTGFTHASSTPDCIAAVKDANAKMRAVAIDSQTVACIGTNSDAGDGISISPERFSGTTSGSVQLGYAELSGESIATMPGAATISPTNSWDAVYNSADNQIWCYYVSSADPRVLMRTAFNLDSYNPVRNEVTVATIGAAGSIIQAIRVERYTPITTNCLVTVAYKTSGGVLTTQYVVDAYNLAPNAPTLTAKANFDATTAQTFSWTFTDPNPGDTQAKYELQIVDVSDGSVDVNTGQITSTTSSHNVTANTLANSKSYQWRVRTYDVAGAVSPWSSYSTFQTGAGGNVTITDPAVDNQANIVSSAYRVAWNVTGTTQASYKVRVVRTSDSSVLSDSGFIAGTETFYQTPGGMLSDTEYRIDVTVRNASNVESGVGSRLITPSFANPPQPTVTVSAVGDGGYVLVSANNPVPGTAELGVAPYYFESNVTPWTATGGTFAQSTAQAHEGTGSGLLTTTGTPTQTIARLPSANAVAVNPGGRYTARFWAYSTAGYANATISIDWLTAAKAAISTSSLVVPLPAATWTEFLITAVAPATAAYANYGPTLASNPPTSTAMYVDELVFLLANDIPDADYNEVLRRVAASDDPYDVLGQFAPGSDFKDYTAAGGVIYEYRVLAVGA